MGTIIGGVASAIIGARSADKAAKASSQGFNYLKSNPLVQAAQEGAAPAIGNISALLGLGGDQAAAQAAFDQYRDSTGYGFRLQQGMDAITGSAAARGLLNSGATAKGLMEYGQNLGSAEFANYLAQLSGVRDTGLNAAFNVAGQGTAAGSGAAQAAMERGNQITSGLGMALGGLQAMFPRSAAAR